MGSLRTLHTSNTWKRREVILTEPVKHDVSEYVKARVQNGILDCLSRNGATIGKTLIHVMCCLRHEINESCYVCATQDMVISLLRELVTAGVVSTRLPLRTDLTENIFTTNPEEIDLDYSILALLSGGPTGIYHIKVNLHTRTGILYKTPQIRKALTSLEKLGKVRREKVGRYEMWGLREDS